MSTNTNVINTIFAQSGVQQVINSMTSAANATDRLAMAQARLKQAEENHYFRPTVGSADAVTRAQQRITIAQRNLTREQFSEATTAAQPFLNVLDKIEKAAAHSIETFRKYGQEVLTMQALTGAGRGESSRAVGLFAAAGISGAGMKDVLKAGSAAFHGEGAGALAMLGIVPQTGQSSLQIFDQVIDKLAGVKDGMLKTQIATRIFGEEGAEALQPLLRMSQAARDQIHRFSEDLGDSAAASQRLTDAQAQLNAGFNYIEVTLGAALAPVLTEFTNDVVFLIDKFQELNKHFNNVGTWALVFAGVTVAIGAVIGAIIAMSAVLKINALWLAITDALSGQWANIAAAAAIGGAAVVGIGALNSATSGGDQVDKLGKHVSNFGRAVNQFGSNIDEFRSKMMPGSLTDADIARLNYQNAIGAIG